MTDHDEFFNGVDTPTLANAFSEVFRLGTIPYGASIDNMPLMDNNTFLNWTERMKVEANKTGIELEFTVNGALDQTANPVGNFPFNPINGQFIEGNNMLIFAGLTDPNALIRVNHTGGGATDPFGAIQGWQIVGRTFGSDIPEPTTALLGLLGMAGLGLRRRRTMCA